MLACLMLQSTASLDKAEGCDNKSAETLQLGINTGFFDAVTYTSVALALVFCLSKVLILLLNSLSGAAASSLTFEFYDTAYIMYVDSLMQILIIVLSELVTKSLFNSLENAVEPCVLSTFGNVPCHVAAIGLI